MMIHIVLVIIFIIKAGSPTLINLLSQVNRVDRYYDLFNRVRTYEITDISGHPLMVASDDFVILQPSSSMTCTSLNFTLNTIRTKQDQDPQSITFFLMYHNKSFNKPGDVFFQRTLLSPNGTGIWDATLDKPIFTSFIINQGDLDDDKVTQFDFNNRSFLPYNETLWFAYFGTGPRHFSHTTSKENFMYWVTLNNNTGSTPIVNPLYKDPLTNRTCPNYHYHYRVIDVNNQLRLNFSDWTDASLVQPIIGVSTNTMNMAWQVQMICQPSSSSFPPPSSLNPTLHPTNIPSYSPYTLTPSLEPTSSNKPTIQPSNEPSSSSSSLEPTLSPSIMNNTNDTNNEEGSKTPLSPSLSTQTTQIIMPLMGLLVFLIVIVCVLVFIYKARERAKKKSIDSHLEQHANDNENALPMVHLTTSEDEQQQDKVWVTDDIYTDVSLESTEVKEVDQISQYINQNISTKRSVRRKINT